MFPNKRIYLIPVKIFLSGFSQTTLSEALYKPYTIYTQVMMHTKTIEKKEFEQMKLIICWFNFIHYGRNDQYFNNNNQINNYLELGSI